MYDKSKVKNPTGAHAPTLQAQPKWSPLHFNSKHHTGQTNKLLGNKYDLTQRIASAAKNAEQSRGVAVIVRLLQANMLTQI